MVLLSVPLTLSVLADGVTVCTSDPQCADIVLFVPLTLCVLMLLWLGERGRHDCLHTSDPQCTDDVAVCTSDPQCADGVTLCTSDPQCAAGVTLCTSDPQCADGVTLCTSQCAAGVAVAEGEGKG